MRSGHARLPLSVPPAAGGSGGEDEVIAVVGDGAITGEDSFSSQQWATPVPIIVILNDNENPSKRMAADCHST